MKGFKSAQDRNLTPTWPNLSSSWTARRPSRPVFYDGFLTSPLCSLRRPRWPQDGSKSAPRGPKRAQEGPKRAQEGPKRAPRRPQDGSKSLPRRVQKRLYVSFTSRPPERPPRPPPDPPPGPPKGPQEGPKRAPRGPQEAPKRAPSGLQEGLKKGESEQERKNNEKIESEHQDAYALLRIYNKSQENSKMLTHFCRAESRP